MKWTSIALLALLAGCGMDAEQQPLVVTEWGMDSTSYWMGYSDGINDAADSMASAMWRAQTTSDYIVVNGRIYYAAPDTIR